MAALVRPAVVADLRAVESVRIATWKVAYRGLLPDELLDGLAVTDERVNRWVDSLEQQLTDLLVAELASRVVGFSAAGPCRDEDLPDARELWGIYLLEECWGTGIGSQLLEQQGQLDVVWVLEGNTQASAFYERHGFRPDGTTRLFERMGASTPERRLVRP